MSSQEKQESYDSWVIHWESDSIAILPFDDICFEELDLWNLGPCIEYTGEEFIKLLSSETERDYYHMADANSETELICEYGDDGETLSFPTQSQRNKLKKLFKEKVNGKK